MHCANELSCQVEIKILCSTVQMNKIIECFPPQIDPQSVDIGPCC
jgi:hypothetical protein